MKKQHISSYLAKIVNRSRLVRLAPTHFFDRDPLVFPTSQRDLLPLRGLWVRQPRDQWTR
jgi:hypothetical protein